MFLACDIGNSNIKAGLFFRNKILESYSFQNLEKLTELYSQKKISGTGISSVVPAKSELLIKFLSRKNFSYHLITAASLFNVRINYKTPETLGSDRICSVEGALVMNGKMKEEEILISIDCGTATTINIIKYPGEFAGGVIGPGFKMLGEALHTYTDQLPSVNYSDFEGMIGDSTKSSIASGIINASAGMIQRVLEFLQSTYQSKKLKIFLTGGNAENIIPYLDFDFIYDKNLVLYGIKAVAELNLPVKP